MGPPVRGQVGHLEGHSCGTTREAEVAAGLAPRHDAVGIDENRLGEALDPLLERTASSGAYLAAKADTSGRTSSSSSDANRARPSTITMSLPWSADFEGEGAAGAGAGGDRLWPRSAG